MTESDPASGGGSPRAGSPRDEAVLGDREVLEGVRRRDRDALGRLFDAAFPYVYALSFRLLGNRAMAEDATQDVFAKVHGSADRLDPARHAKPWLTTITLNTCRDRLRRRARRSEVALDPAALDGIGHTEETPEYQLVQRERQRLLERALESLDQEHREIVALRVFSGHSHEAAAERLGITPAAARKRYSRALQKLRNFVRREEP